MKLDPHEDKMRNKLSSQRIQVDTDQLWSKLEEFVPEQKPRRPKAVFLLWPLLFLSISFGLLSPYRYASAYASMPENPQYEASGSTKAPSFRESLRELQTSFLSDDTEADHANSQGPKNESTSSESKSKSNKSFPNTSTGVKDPAQNFNDENLSEISGEAQIGKDPIVSLITESENPRILSESLDKLDLLDMPILSKKLVRIREYKRIIPPRSKQVVFSLGMSAGAVVQQHLQANTTELDFLDMQKQTDTGRELTGLQLGISYPINKKFYIRSGINYTRASTQLTRNSETYTRVQIDGIQGVWEDNLGNLHQVEGPVYATRKINYQSRWTSYHHMLDVPLSLGFRLLHYKRNLISIEAGATYHMMQTFNGAVWNSEFYLNHDASASNNFNYNNFSARAALEWEYRLNTSYSLFAGVQATDILLKNAGIELITKKRMYMINGIVGVKLYPGNMLK